MPWLDLQSEISEMFDSTPEREYREGVWFIRQRLQGHEYMRQWRKANPSRVKQLNTKWRAENRERYNAWQRAYSKKRYVPKLTQCKGCLTQLSGHRSVCDGCRKTRTRERKHAYYLKNREVLCERERLRSSGRKKLTNAKLRVINRRIKLGLPVELL